MSFYLCSLFRNGGTKRFWARISESNKQCQKLLLFVFSHLPRLSQVKWLRRFIVADVLRVSGFLFFGWIGAASKVLGRKNTEAHHTNILNPQGSTNTSEEAQSPSYPPLTGLG